MIEPIKGRKMPPTVPINNEGKTTFGKQRPKDDIFRDVLNEQVVGRKTMDILELENGKTVVIGTNYEGPIVKDRFLTFFDDKTQKVKTMMKVWSHEIEKPVVVMMDAPQTNKLDKIV